jgi:hypothetical protein
VHDLHSVVRPLLSCRLAWNSRTLFSTVALDTDDRAGIGCRVVLRTCVSGLALATSCFTPIRIAACPSELTDWLHLSRTGCIASRQMVLVAGRKKSPPTSMALSPPDDPLWRYGQPVEPFTLSTLNSGIDQLGIVGTIAPGISAQPERCWRMVYVNASGHANHCGEPVAWRGRHRLATAWKAVWSCEQHAGELLGARRTVRIEV